MKILGIDPGYAIVGYGLVDYSRSQFTVLSYGSILTEAKDEFSHRLKTIYEDYTQILDQFKPDVISIEKLFFSKNVTTGIDVAQARGLILLGAAQRDIPIYEYTPMQAKQALVGYGGADKHQMQEMTRQILHLKAIPKPDDTADALAMAICHAHVSGSLMRFMPHR